MLLTLMFTLSFAVPVIYSFLDLFRIAANPAGFWSGEATWRSRMAPIVGEYIFEISNSG